MKSHWKILIYLFNYLIQTLLIFVYLDIYSLF